MNTSPTQARDYQSQSQVITYEGRQLIPGESFTIEDRSITYVSMDGDHLKFRDELGEFTKKIQPHADSPVRQSPGTDDANIRQDPGGSAIATTPGTGPYLVTWAADYVIDDASTPREAAERAWTDLRHPDSIANAFDVTDANGHTTRVDLWLDTSTNVPAPRLPGPGSPAHPRHYIQAVINDSTGAAIPAVLHDCGAVGYEHVVSGNDLNMDVVRGAISAHHRTHHTNPFQMKHRAASTANDQSRAETNAKVDAVYEGRNDQASVCPCRIGTIWFNGRAGTWQCHGGCNNIWRTIATEHGIGDVEYEQWLAFTDNDANEPDTATSV